MRIFYDFILSIENLSSGNCQIGKCRAFKRKINSFPATRFRIKSFGIDVCVKILMQTSKGEFNSGENLIIERNIEVMRIFDNYVCA